MTKGPIKNRAASVRQRLLNVAHTTHRRFSDVLQHYALERWLFRLSQSKYRDRFVLKGGGFRRRSATRGLRCRSTSDSAT